MNPFKPILDEARQRTYIVWTYCACLIVSLAVTVRVACTLHSNGRIFLTDAFHSNAELADSVNLLLLVGFYLVDIELLKIGMVLLVLGVMHFSNLYVFSKMRERAQQPADRPPFPPDAPAPRV